MITEKFWTESRFPIVYENDQAKAVMVDFDSFKKIGMILDNLINREGEPEDDYLIASGMLKQLLKEVELSSPCPD